MPVKSPIGILRGACSIVGLICLFLASTQTYSETIHYASHIGKSPFNFDEIEKPSDDFIVNDRDSATLDRYLFRSGADYEIVIPIQVRRFVGTDIGKLVEQGLLSPKVKIHIPAFDVDSNSIPIFDCDGDRVLDEMKPEVNEVYFNGELIGVLTGANNIWKFNDQFELDIQKLKFPTVPAGIGHNTIKIKIDVANRDVVLSSGQVGCRVWATEIDWAAVEFKVTSPVAFLPGMFGLTDSWEDSGAVGNLADKTGLPSEILSHGFLDPSIFACSDSNSSFRAHAYEYREQLKNHAEWYRSDAFHLIGHSKGGVDGRMLIQSLSDEPLEIEIGRMSDLPIVAELEAPSLATLGSPHKGTALADAVVAGIGFLNLFASDFCDLTTQNMAKFNQTILPPPTVKTFNGGADADVNSDSVLDDVEVTGNQLSNPAGNIAYRFLRNVAAVEVETIYVPVIGVVSIPIIVRNITPQLNDTLATISSATSLPGVDEIKMFVGPTGKNHGTVLKGEAQDAIINSGISGALDWRLK